MYKGISGAGDRVIQMTKSLEQLENVVAGKVLELKWKKRNSSE